MGCLRNGAILLLTTFLGTLIGYKTGDSLLPVPGWVIKLYARDDRVNTAVDWAKTAGKVWGGFNGAWIGLLIGAAIVAYIIYKKKQNPGR